MRRKDREMPSDFGLQVIDKAPYGTLSITDTEGNPYAIPLSMARSGEFLYFHSAKSGTKVDLLQPGTSVCITFVADVHVPDMFSDGELNEMLLDEKKTHEIARKVFTTQYASAIVFGNVLPVDDENEKRQALQHICEKYTPDKMFLFDAAVQSGIKSTNIYKIVIDRLTAKRKKFDSERNEIKWGNK